MKKIFTIIILLMLGNAIALFSQNGNWKWDDNFNYSLISKNGLYGLMDSNNKIIVPIKYESIEHFNGIYIEVKLNNQYGLIDTTGNEIIPPIYENIEIFDDKFFKVGIGMDRWYIHEYGMQNIDQHCDKYGLLDKLGNIIIPVKYRSFKKLNDSLWVVKTDGKYGIIDSLSNEIIPPKYKHISPFSAGLFLAETHIGYYDYDVIVDLHGNETMYGSIDPCSEGLYRVRAYEEGIGLDGKNGFIDTANQIVIPLVYDKCLDFTDGLAAVELNWKWGFINKLNEIIIPIEYESAKPFENGLAYMEKKGIYYLLDINGVIIHSSSDINEVTDRIWKNEGKNSGETNYGYKRIYTAGHYGLIDKDSNIVLPAIYDAIYNYTHEKIDLPNYKYTYTDGLARVKLNGKVSFIDKNGKVLFPFKYDFLGEPSNGFAVAILNGKAGYINLEGKELTPCIYKNAYPFGKIYGLVEKGCSIFMVSKFGTILGRYKPSTIGGGGCWDFGLGGFVW